MSVLDNPVLVLNKNWYPIRVKNVKSAIQIVSRMRAVFIDPSDYSLYTWKEWLQFIPKEDELGILTPNTRVRVPEVVLLTAYGKIPDKAPRLTRKHIFIRDNYKCQYTGEDVNMKNADIDHIIPSSRGGKNNWGNLVVCSKTVNRKKGNKTPEEAGLELIRKPMKPTGSHLMIDPKMERPESWSNFIK